MRNQNARRARKVTASHFQVFQQTAAFLLQASSQQHNCLPVVCFCIVGVIAHSQCCPLVPYSCISKAASQGYIRLILSKNDPKR
jgi:hypothetical protein